ncbi:battenin-like isoform X2 [Girardinichthys multiradiatus]|uniref:battenin-like isoform X2 n=1 Tax=Girardinichthys multiradiatus TaxID=208333 RepID=UPI001FAE3C3D|nr:battenin-like isoform X2 [Girardinichthys multiradiatus]
MLSAAHDILEKQESKNSTSASDKLTVDFRAGNNSNSSGYDCSPVTTGAVLLADILPTLIIKLFAPFVIHKVPYGFRVLFCVTMAAASFLLVSCSSAVWISIVGVIFASISSGLGELSFLSLSVFFDRNVLEGWGSGTGGAGVAGSFLYSGLIQVGLSPQITLCIMLVVPFAMLVSYFGVLAPVPSLPQWRRSELEYAAVDSEEQQQLMDESEDEEQETSASEDRTRGSVTLKEKYYVIKGLVRFVAPLGLVYFAEYFINQGLVPDPIPGWCAGVPILSVLHKVQESVDFLLAAVTLHASYCKLFYLDLGIRKLNHVSVPSLNPMGFTDLHADQGNYCEY